MALAQAEDGARLPDTSESLWRSLAYFNYYRLALAAVFLAVGLFLGGFDQSIASRDRGLFLWANVAYFVAALGFVASHRRLPLSFNGLVSLQVAVDIIALTLLLHGGGGQKSGLGVMLLVVLAGAGLVGQGRLALFYAALATIAVLLEQTYRNAFLGGGDDNFVRVGAISIAFFATAVSARLLARRVIANEELARRRGIELDNHLRMNERIIRDVHDGVLVLTATGEVRQSNPRADALLGLGPLAGREVSQFLPELAQRLGTETAGGEQELLIRFAPGGKSLRARLIVAAGGDALVFLEDTGRLQAQAQQMKLAALGRLTASIAHEIRNPLSAISHAADLLREEKRGDMQARLTRIIRDNAQRLDRMVRDVLELGRRDRVEPESLAITPFLATFLDEFCLHEKASADLFVRDIEAGAAIVFDRAHFNQVLWNLLSNARRYGSGTPASIRLVARINASTNRCELHIIDDGPGIEDKLRGQVFEPFFTTHSQGTGLGLYIARELCDANGATLNVLENAPGAHFCITGKLKRWELDPTAAPAPN